MQQKLKSAIFLRALRLLNCPSLLICTIKPQNHYQLHLQHGRRETEDIGQETGDWRWETRGRRRETETGGKRQEAKDRRQETGGGSREMGDRRRETFYNSKFTVSKKPFNIFPFKIS